MEKVAFETWEPMVAPYIDLAGEYIITAVVAFVIGMGLLGLGFKFFDTHYDSRIKEQIVAISLLVVGIPVVFAGLAMSSTIELAAYVERYGTFEQRYLEEVAPAIERIQRAEKSGSTSYYDTAIVTKYASDLVKADEAGKTEKPDPVYESIARKVLVSDTGECLADLVDYDRLKRAIGLQDKLNKALMK